MTTLNNSTAVHTVDTINNFPTCTLPHPRDDHERILLRKLDLRMSILVIFYALNLIDRANITNARLQGLEKDLHLHGQQYATTLSILYVGYIFMQVPGQVSPFIEKQLNVTFLQEYVLTLAGETFYHPSVLFVSMGYNISINRDHNELYWDCCRSLLSGCAEAPFYPGMVFLVSKWYKRDELALRIALVACGSFLSSAFGSLLASGILHGMQDKLGGITIFVAICALFILPDFPHNTKWLTPEERALAISRLAEDGYGKVGELGKQTTMQGLRDAVSDWKVWWFAVAAMFQIMAQSLFGYFPTLCATLGYDTTVTLLLCAPPWVFASMVAFFLAWLSDKQQRRYKYFAVSNSLGALALITSICTMNKAARYISLFLMAQMVTAYFLLFGWISNTFAREPAKRAAAIALVNALGQTGNIIGSYVFPSNWGPTYRYSYTICIAALGVSTGMLGGMYLYLKHLNKQIERSERDDEKDVNDVREISFKHLV
ncbi:major facilitator superfamily domain-containing protein [Suillus spraguei]|nr:major facilitator superfamily domain-containing protein [Suillus spraguei]